MCSLGLAVATWSSVEPSTDPQRRGFGLGAGGLLVLARTHESVIVRLTQNPSSQRADLSAELARH